jgi:hypothetical protein
VWGLRAVCCGRALRCARVVCVVRGGARRALRCVLRVARGTVLRAGCVVRGARWEACSVCTVCVGAGARVWWVVYVQRRARAPLPLPLAREMPAAPYMPAPQHPGRAERAAYHWMALAQAIKRLWKRHPLMLFTHRARRGRRGTTLERNCFLLDVVAQYAFEGPDPTVSLSLSLCLALSLSAFSLSCPLSLSLVPLSRDSSRSLPLTLGLSHAPSLLTCRRAWRAPRRLRGRTATTILEAARLGTTKVSLCHDVRHSPSLLQSDLLDEMEDDDDEGPPPEPPPEEKEEEGEKKEEAKEEGENDKGPASLNNGNM